MENCVVSGLFLWDFLRFLDVGSAVVSVEAGASGRVSGSGSLDIFVGCAVGVGVQCGKEERWK